MILIIILRLFLNRFEFCYLKLKNQIFIMELTHFELWNSCTSAKESTFKRVSRWRSSTRNGYVWSLRFCVFSKASYVRTWISSRIIVVVALSTNSCFHCPFSQIELWFISSSWTIGKWFNFVGHEWVINSKE